LLSTPDCCVRTSEQPAPDDWIKHFSPDTYEADWAGVALRWRGRPENIRQDNAQKLEYRTV
jgi:hypothetical protein